MSYFEIRWYSQMGRRFEVRAERMKEFFRHDGSRWARGWAAENDD